MDDVVDEIERLKAANKTQHEIIETQKTAIQILQRQLALATSQAPTTSQDE